ncbi:MAG TPA: methyltransferase domain-containing protein [Solirubrobacteraceae bacterium]
MQRSALATRLERSRIAGGLLMDRVSSALGHQRSREIPDNPAAHPPGSTRVETREHAAAVYLRGSGIEIGALNLPLRVPPQAHVRYVDYLPANALAEHWRERIGAEAPMVIPDVVDDGERLEKFRDRSLDFVIANHFIEHTQDPLGTLASHLRVLRPGGIVFMAVPDKRKTFDALRPVTPVEHLITDHTEGPQVSREAHYVEWAALVERVPEDQVHPHASRLLDQGLSIHFHTWTPDSYLRMLLHCQDTGMPIEIELVQQNEVEFLTVLRKTGAQPA